MLQTFTFEPLPYKCNVLGDIYSSVVLCYFVSLQMTEQEVVKGILSVLEENELILNFDLSNKDWFWNLFTSFISSI